MHLGLNYAITSSMYLRAIVATILGMYTSAVHAGTFPTTNWGVDSSLTTKDIVDNVLDIGISTIYYLCSAIFIIGAFLFTISAGDEKRKSAGKDLMIGAVIGIAIVVGARGILNIVYFLVYGNI